MVLKAESARHMLAAGVNRDDVICENVIKMGTLAQSAISHGVSTMLANLSSSLSVDNQAPEEPEKPFMSLKFKEKRGVVDHQAPAVRGDYHASYNDGGDGDSSVKSQSWLKEYYEGAAKEMYLIHLSKKYAGMTFASASSQIFRETSGNVVLIAVEVVFSTNDSPDSLTASESRVLLNPGQSLIMTEWMQCYVIADDLAHVFEHGICPTELVQEESRRGGVATVLNPLADTFLANYQDPAMSPGNNDQMRTMTAYASLSTPHYSPGLNDKRGSGLSSIQKRQNIVSCIYSMCLKLEKSSCTFCRLC